MEQKQYKDETIFVAKWRKCQATLFDCWKEQIKDRFKNKQR